LIRNAVQPAPQRQTFRLPHAIALLMVVVILAGCRTPQPTFSVTRPVRNTVRGSGFAIHSNFPIEKQGPLVRELENLKKTVTETLQLPEQRDPVAVYLFSDQESYRRYMHATWPNLPPRRAYFVGTNRELAVYSFHSPRIEEDLRHEFTHGLLHASLSTVPLWLDEGLAEYFEGGGPERGAPHKAHLRYLQRARAEGWNPSLYQLEQLSDFQKMTQRDYAEARGWVHYMLHGPPEAKQTLLDYVAELQTKSIPTPLMGRLEKAVPSYYNDMVAHVARTAQGVAVVSNER
jgi:hypothetical protein